MQGVEVSGVVKNIYFCEDGEHALAMSTLVKTEWTLHVETSSTGVHHEITYTLICLEQIRGRYYVTEGNLDCCLWKSVGEAQDGNSVEVELNDEKVPPLIDVIDAFRKCAR